MSAAGTYDVTFWQPPIPTAVNGRLVFGALFTSEGHMDEVTHLSACFDAVLFIDRTSAARRW